MERGESGARGLRQKWGTRVMHSEGKMLRGWRGRQMESWGAGD